MANLLALPPVRNAAIQALLLKEWMRSGVRFNPIAASFAQNPYPSYAQLLRDDPVHWSELARSWVLTRFADVTDVLRDRRFSAVREFSTQAQELRSRAGESAFQRWFETSLLGMDPPDHTRLRRLVSQAFTPRAVESMQPRIAAITAGLVEEARGRHGNRIDLIRDVAYPLPVIVIAEMLGIPAADRALFKRWSDELGAGLDPMMGRDTLRRADRAVEELRDYLRPLFQERRAHPADDLITGLVQAEDAGDQLDEDELYHTVILLLGAGNETTTNLLGNGMLAPLRHPDQLALLRADSSLVPNAVEEMLRYDSPVQFTSRAALEDTSIGGQAIRRGDLVTLILGAANRDPGQFPQPQRFDITRQEIHHLAFGQGIHFCLGAPLARLEAQTAIPVLLECVPALALAEARPPMRPTVTLRGLRRLPVTI